MTRPVLESGTGERSDVKSLGNLCGEVLDLSMGGHLVAYVCGRERHSRGLHVHYVGDRAAVKWWSSGARQPMPVDESRL